MLTACPGPLPSDDDDATDAGPGSDAAMGATLKLEVKLDRSLSATVPGLNGASITITKIYICAVSVRAISDAGSTTEPDYEMEWSTSGIKHEPITFGNPPVGSYSMIDIRIAKRETGSDAVAFEIRGTVDPPGSGDTEFKIVGEANVDTASPPVMLSLRPGQLQTVTLQLDAAQLVSTIDWEMVDKDDGKFDLEDQGTPGSVMQMAKVRGALRTGFTKL